MAKKAYIGVSGTARNVNNIYVGVNGVARKVVKGYVGVNGVAKQFWPEDIDLNYILKDGVLNPQYVISRDLTDYYETGTDQMWVSEINNLSAYFLSGKTLIDHQTNGLTPYYKENNYLTKEYVEYLAALRQYIEVDHLIGVESITFTFKTLSGMDYRFGVGYVNNGQMYVTSHERLAEANSWTDVTLDVSSLPYIDYVYIGGGGGQQAYKDIKIN